MPAVTGGTYTAWLKEARRFGKAIWEITSKNVSVDMVCEYWGKATFTALALVVEKGARVVIGAGTSGVNCSFDMRDMWRPSKRLHGGYCANL